MLLGPVTDHLPYVTTSLQILVQRLYPHINPATQPRPPSRPAGYVRMMQAPLSIITVTLTISHMRRHHTASVDDLKDVVYSRTGLPLQLLAGHQPIADQVIHQVSCTLSLEDLVPLALLPSKISESGSCTVSPAGNGMKNMSKKVCCELPRLKTQRLRRKRRPASHSPLCRRLATSSFRHGSSVATCRNQKKGFRQHAKLGWTILPSLFCLVGR